MATVGTHSLTGWTRSVLKRPSARRDVLIVCPDAGQWEAYEAVFARRGLGVVFAEGGRAGIEASFHCNVAMALIIAGNRDRFAGALINTLRTQEPKPDVWLIGNPEVLCLSEIVLRHRVVVLPETAGPEQFERAAFA